MPKKEKKVQKNDPIKTVIGKWKSIDEERRVFIIIIAIIFFFIMMMPNIYKGWVRFRDHGFHLWSEKTKEPTEQDPTNPNAGKTLTMTCAQTIQDNDYKLEIKTIIYYVDNQLKKEDYTMTRTAISDYGKEELPVRKMLFEPSEKAYQSLEGFTIKSNLENDVFTYNLITDYARVDKDAVTFEGDDVEEGQIRLELEYNQNIDSVKTYYEGQGLRCVK